jgi:alkylation response protein AidB-like acyl-CoA dehydrogenase
MYEYRAPRRELSFVLHEVLEVEAVLAALGRGEVNRSLIDEIIEESAKFSEQVLSPLNWQGDREPPQCVQGVVTAPAAFKSAYQQYRQDGWPTMAGPAEYGGQALPSLAHVPVGELLCSAAMAWRMASGLSEGAVLALSKHGSDVLKSAYLPKLISGEWAGTMCLTEPQAGTDLSILKTRAEPAADGSYRLTGTKIYISWGEHDLTENIIHLVLARMPDAPAGVKGISLFLVPKRLDGKANGVSCLSIEHKMGIHGSPTCVMSFEQATGFLIDKPGGGLACMFTMMNQARLGVGLQGLGLSERALQAATHYALERLQGRASHGAEQPNQNADPIVVHADVRRMLMTIKSQTEAQRLLVYYTYLLEDTLTFSSDAKTREGAALLASLLVPIVKANLTDAAFEHASLALQVHGGSGFIRDTGVEQYVRDARITMIYEGTNGIQALDLLGRKVLMNGGAAVQLMIKTIQNSLPSELPQQVQPWAAALATQLAQWGELTALVGGRVRQDPEELGAVAVDYLQYCACLLLGWCWVRMAIVAARQVSAGSAEAPYYQAKLAAAAFYFERLWPKHLSLAAGIRAGGSSLPRLTSEQWSA